MQVRALLSKEELERGSYDHDRHGSTQFSHTRGVRREANWYDSRRGRVFTIEQINDLDDRRGNMGTLRTCGS